DPEQAMAGVPVGLDQSSDSFGGAFVPGRHRPRDRTGFPPRQPGGVRVAGAGTAQAGAPWGRPRYPRTSARRAPPATSSGGTNARTRWTVTPAPSTTKPVRVPARTAPATRASRTTWKENAHAPKRAAVLHLQADTFDTAFPNPSFAGFFGIPPIVAGIARE